MRISDWSSDVCSSDLHVLHFAKIGEFDRAAVRKADLGLSQRIGALGVAEHAHRLLRAGDLGEPARLIGVEQIGRASSRERVCQYVSISVGHVSLKNKQIECVSDSRLIDNRYAK